MADTEREGSLTLKNVVQGATVNGMATPLEYVDVTKLRTRLTAINGTYFTTAKLNTMTKNDMIYAVRLADDANTI